MPRLHPLGIDHVDHWLRSILWDNKLLGDDNEGAYEVHRSKGRIVFTDGTVKMLQGVREVFDLSDAPGSEESSSQQGKIIFIGRRLGEKDFQQSFNKTVSDRCLLEGRIAQKG